jgi:hypothetical protein
MDVFTVGLLTLAGSTIVFYIVLFSFIFYWHLVKVSYLVVPMIFTFEFFIIGFFIVAIVSIILNYLPILAGA